VVSRPEEALRSKAVRARCAARVQAASQAAVRPVERERPREAEEVVAEALRAELPVAAVVLQPAVAAVQDARLEEAVVVAVRVARPGEAVAAERDAPLGAVARQALRPAACPCRRRPVRPVPAPTLSRRDPARQRAPCARIRMQE
jgi:hypothetical protein